MLIDQTVSQWFQDPEFVKLPTSDKRETLAHYFNTELVDDEFHGLSRAEQERTRNNFINSHVEAFRPEPPSRSLGADLANVAKRAPAGIGELLLQGVAMHDRLADRVAIKAPAVGLAGGAEESPGFDLKDWAAKKAGELADWKEDKLPMSKETMSGGVRGAVTQGVESAMVSLGSKLPATAAGLAMGGLPGAVAGYLTGVPLFGAAQYNEAERRYLDSGYAPAEAAEAARLEAYSEMGFEGVSDVLELLTLGAGRVLTAPAKEIMKESLESMLAGSWKQVVKKGAAVTASEAAGELANAGTQAEIQKHYETGTREFWGAVNDQLGPVGVASLIFGGLGGGLHMANIRQTRQALVEPVPDGLEEKEYSRRRLRRVEAVGEVEKAIKAVSPNLAAQWRTHADQVVAANNAFDLGMTFDEAAAIPVDDTMAGSGRDVADASLAEARLNEQQAAEQQRRLEKRQQVLEAERQTAQAEKAFVAAVVDEQAQAAMSPPAESMPAEDLTAEEMSPAQQMMQDGTIPGLDAAPAQQETAPAGEPVGDDSQVMPGVNPAADAAFVRQLVEEQQAVPTNELSPAGAVKTDGVATLTGRKKSGPAERNLPPNLQAAMEQRLLNKEAPQEGKAARTKEEQLQRAQALELLRSKRRENFTSDQQYLDKLKEARDVLQRLGLREDKIEVAEAERLIPFWEKNVAEATEEAPPVTGENTRSSEPVPLVARPEAMVDPAAAWEHTPAVFARSWEVAQSHAEEEEKKVAGRIAAIKPVLEKLKTSKINKVSARRKVLEQELSDLEKKPQSVLGMYKQQHVQTLNAITEEAARRAQLAGVPEEDIEEFKDDFMARIQPIQPFEPIYRDHKISAIFQEVVDEFLAVPGAVENGQGAQPTKTSQPPSGEEEDIGQPTAAAAHPAQPELVEVKVETVPAQATQVEDKQVGKEPAQAQVFPPAELAGIKVKLKVELPDGQTGTYEVPAAKALADVDEEIRLYELILDCVRK